MNATNVEVRSTEPGDFLAVQRLFAQPQVIRGTLQLPFPSAEGWRQRLSETRSGHYSLVACIDAAVVGSGGLHLAGPSPRRRHAAELGLAVHDDWHGQGVGSALLTAILDLADNWLDLKRVELTVYADNARAIRLYARFGFEREGCLRAFAFRDGNFEDALVMARVRA